MYVPVLDICFMSIYIIVFLSSVEGLQPDSSAKASQQRRMVSKWAREDLEEKYLKQYEENQDLKKHAKKQEERIKR